MWRASHLAQALSQWQRKAEKQEDVFQSLTCIRLDGPIFERSDDPCEQAPLIERVAHFVRFQTHRSIELCMTRGKHVRAISAKNKNKNS
jgi:hypothetical protein